jgi:hypothetical protein
MRHIIALVYALLSLCCLAQLNHARAQLPNFEFGDECMDWFLLAWSEIERVHAIAGVSEYSGTARNGTTSEAWFSIKLVSKKKEEIHYCESEKIWGNGAGAGIWSKTLKRGGTSWWSYGDLGKPLARFPDPQVDANGKEIDIGTPRPFYPPDPFLFTAYSPGAYEDNACDRKYVTGDYQKNEIENCGITEKSNFSTLYWKDTFGCLLEFDKKHGMPLMATGYFKSATHKGKTGPDAFKDVNYISQSKWECVDDAKGIYAPVYITSFMNRISPKVRKTLLLELSCSYRVKDLSEELLSDENMKLLLLDKGPIASLRKELYDSARKRRKKD